MVFTWCMTVTEEGSMCGNKCEASKETSAAAALGAWTRGTLMNVLVFLGIWICFFLCVCSSTLFTLYLTGVKCPNFPPTINNLMSFIYHYWVTLTSVESHNQLKFSERDLLGNLRWRFYHLVFKNIVLPNLLFFFYFFLEIFLLFVFLNLFGIYFDT